MFINEFKTDQEISMFLLLDNVIRGVAASGKPNIYFIPLFIYVSLFLNYFLYQMLAHRSVFLLNRIIYH